MMRFNSPGGMRRPLGRLVLALAVPLAAAALAASMRPAQAAPLDPRQVRESADVALTVNQGTLIRLPAAAQTVFIADPKVASYQVPSPTSVFLFGKDAGQTTLYALGDDDQVILATRVRVQHDLAGLQSQIEQDVPDAEVSFAATSNGLVVRGRVPTPLQAAQVMESVQAFVGEQKKVVNQLQVLTPAQVNISVRVVEVSRSLSSQLGFNWSSVLRSGDGKLGMGLATGAVRDFYDPTRGVFSLPDNAPGVLGVARNGSRGSLSGLLTALSEQGLVSVLAEPNLTALSGQTASFVAGGEFPVPMLGADNEINVQFKNYGVVLRLTPTLLSGNRISLRVAPEVSELTNSGAVRIRDLVIPALAVRRADTTVELASGQSFMLAGMLKSSLRQDVQSVPGVSRLPLVGRAFSSNARAHDETELVILVTAYVVDPASPDALQVPGRGLQPNDNLLAGQPARQAAPGFLF